jgi:hypothetical protein|eukprot:3053619-Prymnesium_polylepis.1
MRATPWLAADRVGIVRKLRLNQTLKRSGDGFTLDMTSARYKTSRFYGPVRNRALPTAAHPHMRR